MADFQLRLRDLLAPVEVQTGKVNRFVVSPFAGGLLEMEDVNFHFDSAVLLPNQTTDAGTLAEQDSITGIDVLAVGLLQAEARSDEVLLVVGHTDRVGDASYNVALSQLRADNVLHALLGDRAEWAKISNSKFQIEDYQQILKWVAETFGFDCDPGEVDGIAGTQTFLALKAFQAAYNAQFPQPIKVNGVISEETWRAFFDMYMEDLKSGLGADDAALAQLRSQVRFLDAKKRSVGCGFNHPVDEERLSPAAATPGAPDAPAFRSAKDRRVELLFFPPSDLPKLDCHPAANKCNPAVCEIYGKRQFEFDYIRVAKIGIVDFFVRPTLDDSAATTPHNAIVLPGDSVTLHWVVQNTDRVEIAATINDGTQSLVTLPAGGRVTLSATPQTAQVSLVVSEDTIFTLKAFNDRRRVQHPVSLNVHLLGSTQTNSPQFVTGADSIEVVSSATPLEIATRTINLPIDDTRIAGKEQPLQPVLVPPAPKNAVAPKSSSPKLIDFKATTLSMEKMSPDNMRARAVATIRRFNAYGHADSPPGRREAYGDLIAFGEDSFTRTLLLKKALTNSSCALVIRSLWRLLGCRDFVEQGKTRGKPPKKGLNKQFLLEPPFLTDGLLMSRLVLFAQLCNAHHNMGNASEQAKFNPLPGDVILQTMTEESEGKDKAGNPVLIQNAKQHIFTVIGVKGNQIFSVDGGQVSPKKLADGTVLKLDDGGCNGIWPHVRTLNPTATNMTLIDRTKLVNTSFANRGKSVTGSRLSFKGESRPIEGWIELPKLRFAETIIEIVKNPGKVKPGFADTGIPSLLEVLPEAKIL